MEEIREIYENIDEYNGILTQENEDNEVDV